MRSCWSMFPLLTLLALLGCGGGAPAGSDRARAPQTLGSSALQSEFEAAAREFGVPAELLLAVAFNETRWESHAGEPSAAGGYGIMHLTEVDAPLSLRDATARLAHGLDDSASHTLRAAAGLLGVAPGTLRTDRAQNIRGGAALLAAYAKDAAGGEPLTTAHWYAAVAHYSGAPMRSTARLFADDVFSTLQTGASRLTREGEQVILPPTALQPDRSALAALPLQDTAETTPAECPHSLDCNFVPAAYAVNDPSDLEDYGNYDIADRPADGTDIRYIVIHDTESSYADTLKVFQDPSDYASANYVLRSSDGQVTQMVPNTSIAWHAGNWYMNMHAIGIEHEGHAVEGATWYSEAMYRSSARLVRYLARRHHVPLDREHIIGHDNVPGTGPNSQTQMHWDPGPFWDWAHLMELAGAPLEGRGHDIRDGEVLMIRPAFRSNQPSVTYGGAPLAAQSANFVYLRTGPSEDAPYVENPALPGRDPLSADNWADKAVTGQRFVSAGRQGEWQAIYFGGQVAWFNNPWRQPVAVAARGKVVTPKEGLATIDVYGEAVPETAAYPASIPDQSVKPFSTLAAGERYVAFGPYQSDYYWADFYATQLEGSDHQRVVGTTSYYALSFNHRLAFVKADDVRVVHEEECDDAAALGSAEAADEVP